MFSWKEKKFYNRTISNILFIYIIYINNKFINENLMN